MANVGDWVSDRVHGGAASDETPSATVVDVVYESVQPGYRGWSWVVSVGEVAGEAPSVLELGLVPGEGALLAPEWIPWSVRLAEWQAQQLLLAEAAGAVGDADTDESDDEADDDDDDDDEDDVLDDDDDEDDSDDDDDEDEGPRATHSGDIDGVDIDDLEDLDSLDKD